MRMVVALLFVAVSAISTAQSQPSAQSVQEQLVSIYVNLNYSLAKQVDTANAQIADLQKQLAAEKAKNEKQGDEKAK